MKEKKKTKEIIFRCSGFNQNYRASPDFPIAAGILSHIEYMKGPKSTMKFLATTEGSSDDIRTFQPAA